MVDFQIFLYQYIYHQDQYKSLVEGLVQKSEMTKIFNFNMLTYVRSLMFPRALATRNALWRLDSGSREGAGGEPGQGSASGR